MRTLTEAIEKVKETLESKGMKYGKTYVKVGQALGVPPQFSILVRMFEKMFRVRNILRTGPPETNTKLTNEFLDIACYAILAMFESSIEKENPNAELKSGEFIGVPPTEGSVFSRQAIHTTYPWPEESKVRAWLLEDDGQLVPLY